MKAIAVSCAVWGVLCLAAAGEDGFKPIFDGKSLAGWETPDPSYWSVEDGAITARITQEHPCQANQYLVWTGGELADFELKLQSRIAGQGALNNGFQFRSRLLPDHDICGYQVDNNLETPWLVRLYDEYGRHTLALRGERAQFSEAGVRQAAPISEAAGAAWFRLEEWHEYHLICLGPKLTLRVNGRLVAEVEDNDPRRRELQGIFALQLHSGPPSVAQFKEIQLKILKPAETNAAPAISPLEERRAALRKEAFAWWRLDTGGHGARPALAHVPQFEQIELNVAADGPGARPGARNVILDGAYFTAGSAWPLDGAALTVMVRARDPRGEWNGGLFSKDGGRDRSTFQLCGADLDETPGPDVGFAVRTEHGIAQVSFPVSMVGTNAWHDLVGRYDGAALSLFCDGRLLAHRPHSGKMVANSEPLLIGAETDAGKVARRFRGEFEEAALWPRALADEEVRALSYLP